MMVSEFTIGVDLATESSSTGLCIINWSGANPTIHVLKTKVDDQEIAREFNERNCTIAIDCPFGWPNAFVDFVTQHRAHHPGGLEPFAKKRPRDPYRLRKTDLWVRDKLREHKDNEKIASAPTPLSVSTDKLGSTALRCAQLLNRLKPDLDRAGTDRIIEVYPAASLAIWKHNVKVGWDDFITWTALTGDGLDTTNSHCRDAVVAAVAARIFDLGGTHSVDEAGDDREAALAEGWIHLPKLGSTPFATHI